jgi:hypothetical protein
MVMRVASFFPFQTSYYLNGHSFIEQELKRAQIGFRKIDNAFSLSNDVTALQAAADRLSADIIRKRVDYWTLVRLETKSLQCSDDDGPKADLAREHNMHGNRRVALAGELELLNPPRCRAG